MDDASGSDSISIMSSNSVLSPQTQNDNQDDEVEDQDEPPNNDNDNDSDGTAFGYRGFGQMDRLILTNRTLLIWPGKHDAMYQITRMIK